MTDKIRAIRSLLPAGTYWIHGLSLASITEDESCRSDLLLKVTSPVGRGVSLHFRNVRNLVFRSGPYARIQVAGLVIEDRSEDQWQGVRFRVTSEDEESMISFLCTDIDGE